MRETEDCAIVRYPPPSADFLSSFAAAVAALASRRC
jgi:hypothetical protein